MTEAIKLAVFEKKIPTIVGTEFVDVVHYVICNEETEAIMSPKFYTTLGDATAALATSQDYAEGVEYTTACFPGIKGAALKTKANAVAAYLKWVKDGRKITELKVDEPVAGGADATAPPVEGGEGTADAEDDFFLEDEDEETV